MLGRRYALQWLQQACGRVAGKTAGRATGCGEGFGCEHLVVNRAFLPLPQFSKSVDVSLQDASATVHLMVPSGSSKIDVVKAEGARLVLLLAQEGYTASLATPVA
eukprot:213604-Chlamydomonas_euryale.AAC.43